MLCRPRDSRRRAGELCRPHGCRTACEHVVSRSGCGPATSASRCRPAARRTASRCRHVIVLHRSTRAGRSRQVPEVFEDLSLIAVDHLSPRSTVSSSQRALPSFRSKRSKPRPKVVICPLGRPQRGGVGRSSRAVSEYGQACADEIASRQISFSRSADPRINHVLGPTDEKHSHISSQPWRLGRDAGRDQTDTIRRRRGKVRPAIVSTKPVSTVPFRHPPAARDAPCEESPRSPAADPTGLSGL